MWSVFESPANSAHTTRPCRINGGKTMKTVRKHWKLPLLCAALILALLLTACGGSSSGGSAGASGNPGDTGAEAGTAGGDDSGKGDDSVGAGGSIYDANDIEIILTDVTEAEGYDSLDFEITNKGSKALMVQLYPLVINNALSVSQGVFHEIEPGETVSESVFLELTTLDYVGISSIGEIDGYVVINDPDNHYGPIAEPELITIMKNGSEVSAPDLAHSDQVIFDADGICVSYLGTYNDMDHEPQAVFFVTNNTEDVANIGTPFQEELIDGKPAEDRIMILNGASIMPGDCTIVTASVFDSGTLEPAAFDTLDMDLTVSTDNNDWIPTQIPCHLKMEGDKLALTADAPYITEEMQQLAETRKERKAEQEAEEQHEADLEANEEEVKDPEIAGTRIYNYAVSKERSSAIITALVRNPNERTALYHVKLDCKAYDADNNLLDEPKLNGYNDFVIMPEKNFPFVFTVHELEGGTEIDHVEITLAGYDSVNTLDLDKKASSYYLEMPAEEIYLNDPVVEEGHEDSSTFSGRRPANLTGTLVNDGDAAKMAYIIYTLYDKDGEIILAGKRLESELAPGEIPDFYEEFGPAVYKLPGYDHIDITCFKRAGETE